MTVEDLLVETYELLGEPSDLPIYTAGTTTVDLTQIGSVKILKWINRAYKRIINWKFPNGSQVRFPAQITSGIFQNIVDSCAVASAPSSSSLILDASARGVAGIYNECVLKITSGAAAGYVGLIVNYTAGRVASLVPAMGTSPSALDTVKIYKRKFFFRSALDADVAFNLPLSPISEIAAVLKVTDISNGSDLTQEGRIESFASNLATLGDPCSYIVHGNSLIFDVAPDDEDFWFKIEYSKIPSPLIALTDEPLIPDSFNEALLLYTQWIGLRRSQEWGGAYSTKRDIEDLMSTLKTSLEMAFEREDIGAMIY